MNSNERWAYYDSGELQRTVAIDLIDWAGYWTNAGLDGFNNDPIKKRQMRFCVNQILTDLAYIIKIVSTIAMSYPAIKDANAATGPSEADIASVVNDIMSYRLAFVSDIFPSEAEE